MATPAQTIRRLDQSGLRIYHKPDGASYASGANRKVIREKSRDPHYVGHDFDINPNKDGTPWCHHQLRPTRKDAWFDPRHRIGDHHYARDLTDAQMGRLVVHYHGNNWHMLTAKQAAEECARQPGDSYIPCYEAKFTSKLYLDPQWWHDQFIEGWGPELRPVIMTLPGTDSGRTGLKKLSAAHEVGLPTMWLWRGDQPIVHTRGWLANVDLVKSRPHRGIYRP